MKQPDATPSSEMDETQRLRARVVELEQQLTEAKAQIQGLSGASGGFAAYIIRTPNKGYTGQTAGLYFRDGVAVLPVSQNAEELIWKMKNDFNYQVELVDDWRNTPESAATRMQMVDVMAGG